MALPLNDSFGSLERLRQSLEKSIDQLRKSLQYWQTWEYEYEGLKEEFERSDSEPSTAEMLAIGKSLKLDLVAETDVKEVLNYGKTPPRSRVQVISQINGRINTGQRNASTIQKQLAVVEEKLEKVLIVQEPSLEGEEGEQLMDIFEELDEDGNIISSSVVNADKDREMLGKVMSGGVFPTQTDKNIPSNMNKVEKENHTHPTQRMLILDDHDNLIASKPLELMSKPTEDEAIDHMREARANAASIAPIVATFDIEEDSDYEDEHEDYSDLEDEYGMGDTSAELTDDYRSQMEALMQKHAIAMENAGPQLNQTVIRKLDNAHRDVAIASSTITKEGENNLLVVNKSKASALEGKIAKSTTSKSVRFAEELDLSSGPDRPILPVMAEQQSLASLNTITNPIAEAVVERSSTTPLTPASSSILTRRPSRFKTSLNTTSNGKVSQDTNVNIIVGEPPAVCSDSLAERPKKVSRFKASKMEP